MPVALGSARKRVLAQSVVGKEITKFNSSWARYKRHHSDKSTLQRHGGRRAPTPAASTQSCSHDDEHVASYVMRAESRTCVPREMHETKDCKQTKRVELLSHKWDIIKSACKATVSLP